MKPLSQRWQRLLLGETESGMGYHLVRVRLTDGRTFDNVTVLQAALIVEVNGARDIPFDPDDIADIQLLP